MLKASTWKKIFVYWFPVIAWMGLIYFLSSFHKLQASTIGWQDYIIRKTAHFSEYAILFTIIYRGFLNTTKLSLGNRLMLSLFFTILYAMTDEYHQTFVSGRTGKFVDIGIDSFGAIFGFIFNWKIILYLPTKFREALRRVGI